MILHSSSGRSGGRNFRCVILSVRMSCGSRFRKLSLVAVAILCPVRSIAAKCTVVDPTPDDLLLPFVIAETGHLTVVAVKDLVV